MFSRISTVALLTLTAFITCAAAVPGGWGTPTKTVTVTATPSATPEPAGNCNAGGLQCCNTVEPAGTPAAAALLGLLGVVVQGVDVLVGLSCDPITVIGLGQGGCQAQAVCCEDNSSSLISVGCIPVQA